MMMNSETTLTLWMLSHSRNWYPYYRNQILGIFFLKKDGHNTHTHTTAGHIVDTFNCLHFPAFSGHTFSVVLVSAWAHICAFQSKGDCLSALVMLFQTHRTRSIIRSTDSTYINFGIPGE